jgi:hypothetical protein
LPAKHCDDEGVTRETVLHRAAIVAAGLAFSSAAVTAYWTLGGTALLDTVGGYAEDLARTGGPLAVLVGIIVVAVKVVGGLVALGLAYLGRGRKLHRPLLLVGGLGSGLLIIYGGLLIAVGALVLTGILQPADPVDRRALTWHVLLWDLWFLLWGLALATTTWRSKGSSRPVT